MLRSDRLKSLRKERGLIQQDIAKFLKVGRTTYVKYENGDSDPPVDTVSTLATYFQTSTDYLLGNSDDPTPPDAKKEAPSAMTTEEAIVALFKAEKGREPTAEELNMFRAFTKPVLDSLPDKAD